MCNSRDGIHSTKQYLIFRLHDKFIIFPLKKLQKDSQ